MVGIELVEEDGRTPSQRLAAACLEACKAEGVLLGKGGLYGNCLRIAPPLCITLEEAEEGASVIADALTRLSGAERADR